MYVFVEESSVAVVGTFSSSVLGLVVNSQCHAGVQGLYAAANWREAAGVWIPRAKEFFSFPQRMAFKKDPSHSARLLRG